MSCPSLKFTGSFTLFLNCRVECEPEERIVHFSRCKLLAQALFTKGRNMKDISADNASTAALPVQRTVIASASLPHCVINVNVIVTDGDESLIQALHDIYKALHDLSILDARRYHRYNLYSFVPMIAETPIVITDAVETVSPRCCRSLVIATSDILSSSTVTSTFSGISAFVDSAHSFFALASLPPPQSTLVSNVQPQMSTLDLHVIRFLGEGTSGKVYLVKDQLSRAKVALKVVPKEGKNDYALGVVLKERKIAEKLSDSPWFVGLWAAWGDKKNLYIAMTAYPTDLDSEMLRCGTIEPARARFYMAEIILALTELHSRGIIHRDIKAPNILIDCEGHIVLADFGLSKDFGEQPRIAERVFQPYWPYLRSDNPTSETPARDPKELTFVTWDYTGSELEMAPEVHSRMAYSFGVDFWSAAVVLYWMLTGRPPFYVDDDDVQFVGEEETEVKPLAQKIAEDPLYWDPTDNVDDTTKDFLEKMMEKNPNARLMISYEMLNHPYFKETNWILMEDRKVSTPWVPSPGTRHVHEPTSLPFTPGEPFTADSPDPYPEFNFISQAIAERVIFKDGEEGADDHDYDSDEEPPEYLEDDEGSDTMTDLADVKIMRFGSYEDLHSPTFIDPPTSPSDLQTSKSDSINKDIPLKEVWDVSIIDPLPILPYGPGSKERFNDQDLVKLRPLVADTVIDNPTPEPPVPPGLGGRGSTPPSPLKPTLVLHVEPRDFALPPLVPRRRSHQPSRYSTSDTTSSLSFTPQRTRHIVNGTGVLFKVKVWMSRLWPPKSRKIQQLKRLSVLG